MMEAIEVWNAAVRLRQPTVGDLKALATRRAVQVYADEPGLHWIAPNLLLETTLGFPSDDDSFVINLILGFKADYFLAPTNPGVMMTSLASIRWNDVYLPCSVEELIRNLRGKNLAPVELMTESDENDRTTSWAVECGALTFEFFPIDDSCSPKASELVSVTYSYSIPPDHSVSLVLYID